MAKHIGQEKLIHVGIFVVELDIEGRSYPVTQVSQTTVVAKTGGDVSFDEDNEIRATIVLYQEKKKKLNVVIWFKKKEKKSSVFEITDINTDGYADILDILVGDDDEVSVEETLMAKKGISVEEIEPDKKSEIARKKTQKLLRKWVIISAIFFCIFTFIMIFIFPPSATHTLNGTFVSKGFKVTIPAKAGKNFRFNPLITGSIIELNQSIGYYEPSDLPRLIAEIDEEITALRKARHFYSINDEKVSIDKTGTIHSVVYEKNYWEIQIRVPGKFLFVPIPVENAKFFLKNNPVVFAHINGEKIKFLPAELPNEIIGVERNLVDSDSNTSIIVSHQVIQEKKSGTIINVSIPSGISTPSARKGYVVEAGYTFRIPNDNQRTKLDKKTFVGSKIKKGDTIAIIKPETQHLVEDNKLILAIEKLKIRKEYLLSLEKNSGIQMQDDGRYLLTETITNGAKVVHFLSVDEDFKQLPFLLIAEIEQEKDLPIYGDGWIDWNGKRIEGTYEFVTPDQEYYGHRERWEGGNLLIFTPAEKFNGAKVGAPKKIYVKKSFWNFILSKLHFYK